MTVIVSFGSYGLEQVFFGEAGEELVKTENRYFLMMAHKGDGNIGIFSHEAMMTQVPGKVLKRFKLIILNAQTRQR